MELSVLSEITFTLEQNKDTYKYIIYFLMFEKYKDILNFSSDNNAN